MTVVWENPGSPDDPWTAARAAADAASPCPACPNCGAPGEWTQYTDVTLNGGPLVLAPAGGARCTAECWRAP